MAFLSTLIIIAYTIQDIVVIALVINSKSWNAKAVDNFIDEFGLNANRKGKILVVPSLMYEIAKGLIVQYVLTLPVHTVWAFFNNTDAVSAVILHC